MQVTLIVSRFFDNTRAFTRALAREAGLPLVLLEGNVDFEYGVRALRLSQRVWFEGTGPFLDALLRAPRSWQLPRACLRVAEDDVPRLPLPDLWNVVSDLVVPTPVAAVTLLAIMTAQARANPAGPAPGRVNIAGAEWPRWPRRAGGAFSCAARRRRSSGNTWRGPAAWSWPPTVRPTPAQ
ncbi:MAG: hypothetical protein NTU94_18025 [Planctomycetota bacterium]|nr:hypothetical protein [Planctomycetota bacterium]